MLSLLGNIYGKVANLRNRLYDRGVLDSFDLGSRTISIGNITTGGTGKTPLVAYVANILAERGEKVCILTRGYGRENPKQRVLVSDGNEIFASVSEAGDEPFELAQKLIGKAIIIADADRVAAAEWAKRKFGVTAFVLDDGFQHRRAKRDVDIVCIDATNPFGGGKMLPVGRLREPLKNLARANAIVITRANMIENTSDFKSQISNFALGAPVFEAENLISNIIVLEEFHAGAAKTQSFDIKKCAFAFCGVGNPDNFFNQIRLEGINVVASDHYPDHHRYSQKDIQKQESAANRANADFLITTAKDAVKLSNLRFEIPIYVVEIKMKLIDEVSFAALL